MLHLRICFMLFTSAQFLNAAKIEISDPDVTFAYGVKISSLSVKEPNQYHFIKYVAAKQVFLGIHHDWLTFSLYESDATQTLYTFRQKEIDFENFHAKSMSFQAKENDDVYHFRVTFMASKSQLDTVYPWLSHCTGNGILSYKLGIVKVESYVGTTGTGPIIQEVEDLKPAMFHEQKIEAGRYKSSKMVYKITPLTSMSTVRKFARLVFRSGTFRVGRVNNKVVLELEGFEDCLYILYFESVSHAVSFIGFVNGKSIHVALSVPVRVLSYLKAEPPQTSTQDESTSQSAEDDPRTLQLAHWGDKPLRGD